MLKTAKLYSLLFIIVASTIVGIFDLSSTAKAQTEDPTPWKDQKVIDEANIITMGHMVSLCIEYTSKNKTHPIEYQPTKEQIRDGDWFKSFASTYQRTPVGFAHESAADDGEWTCNDDYINLSKTFVPLAGWADEATAGNYRSAACHLSFRLAGKGDTSVEDCTQGFPDSNDYYYGKRRDERGDNDKNPDSGDNDYDFTLLSNLPRGKNVVLEDGKGEFGYNNVHRYLLYLIAFTAKNGCDATLGGIHEDGNGYGSIKIVNTEGKIVSVNYSGAKDKDVSVLYNTKKQCSDLPDLIASVAPAYSKWMSEGNTTTNNNQVGSTTEDAKSNCTIAGIGWIICPVVNFFSQLADSSYYLLDKFFLKLPPVNATQDDQNGLWRAWSYMRDLANVIFVIAFMVLVFSQVTSMGVSNYGIKRMAPRLIIAAILVNLSFYICAVGVDISNTLGSSLKQSIDGIVESIRPENGGSTLTGDFWSNKASGLLGGAIVVGALGVASYAGFAVFTLLLFVVLPVIAAVVVTMLVRQALVVLLIFISPLAFVAMLLPNTEEYFKKWLTAFKLSLLFYPIVAVVFGAAALASQVLGAAADSQGDVAQTVSGIVAGAVRVLPLIAIPSLLKFSNSLLGRFGGVLNDPGKGFFDKRRGIAMEKSQIRQAKRVEQIGNFVNKPGGSRARRGLGRLIGSASAYGANIREKERKSDLDTAQKTMNRAFLESERGIAASARSTNAQLELHEAEIHAETVRLESPEGMRLQQQSLEGGMRKTIAENRAQTAALQQITTTSPELNIQAATSAEQLAGIENKNKLAYEEAVATRVPGGAGPVPSVTADAQAARQDLNTVSGALDSARRVGELNYAEAIKSNDALAAAAGGIDPGGAARAKARAASTLAKNFHETVEVEKAGLSTAEVGSAVVGPAAPDSLKGIMEDAANSPEKRAAAASKIIEIGSTNDIMSMIDYLGKTPGTTAIQQQVANDLGARKPASVGAGVITDMKLGEFTGNMDAIIVKRIEDGKMSAEAMAGMSKDELERITTVLAGNAALRARPEFSALQNQILDYRTSPGMQGRQPATEITNKMDDIMNMTP